MSLISNTSMALLSELEPADHKQCQVDKPSGYTFMTFGGRPGDMIRCTNKPAAIVTENEPGKDGQKGSMSVCASCLNYLVKQVPLDSVTFSGVNI